MADSCTSSSGTLCEDMQEEGPCLCQMHEESCVVLFPLNQDKDCSKILDFSGGGDSICVLPALLLL